MASPVSSTRSAARATYSAYKRQPIRWRLAGGSAALTLVILLGFAVIVGTLTTRAIYSDFNRQVASAADRLEQKLQYDYGGRDPKTGKQTFNATVPLDPYASSTNAAIRVVYPDGRRFDGSSNAPSFGPPNPENKDVDGWRVETRELRLYPGTANYYLMGIQYARRTSDVRATANRVKVFLGLGVLGGAALSLLAGLATARRAIRWTSII